MHLEAVEAQPSKDPISSATLMAQRSGHEIFTALEHLFSCRLVMACAALPTLAARQSVSRLLSALGSSVLDLSVAELSSRS